MFARFPRFLNLIGKFITEQNMLSLHCTRSAATYKISRTPNNRAQLELWTEIVNACPIIDRLTRPILPSGVPNGEYSKLCAADGWIDEGWEHVTGTLSKLSG